ncbi:4-hydroxyphenylacetate catabolism regulatory protein HpaA [Patiriisocius marinistellae]|uniref:4-hydroxyphenylacetate catabolism regulatory protein HpaA n=1 Tax=Patiriisocius marinistellae TaxID=2494560 RepID=A0A5J4G1V3_9FLAO|nr:AraC family transcriptional regulator [Patiriisocius marinistellae]GEQ86031.1 4-hydroxyphenylacetate catabolism regulatory protein HpaA [Patiriisocius marinistellae]
MPNKIIENTIIEYHLNRHQPDKPQFAIHDLKEYITKHKGFTTKPHIHSYYQVLWFKKGKGKHFVDFKAYNVDKDSVFFIAKNQVHYFDDNTDYEGILLHFNETFIVQKDNETDFFLKYNLFNNPYLQPLCPIKNASANVFDEYISQIKREFANPDEFGKEELLKAYLKAFLIQIQRTKQECDQTQNDIPIMFDEKRVQLIKFINLIDENYTKGLTVAEYARLLFISSRTLSDLTNQLLNKTPSQIIKERIILEAQRLLLYSDLNVNQIGYRLGFDDPSYFVKYFKKNTNSSPLEFRKSVS